MDSKTSEITQYPDAQPPNKLHALRTAFDQWCIDTSNVTEPKSPSDIFAVFQYNVVDEVSKNLPTDFKRFPTNCGTLILQKGFLDFIQTIPDLPMPTEVQSDLQPPKIEVWKKLCDELTEIGAEKLLADYLDGISSQRDTHNHLLLRAFSSLDTDAQDDILALIPTLKFGGSLTHLVGAVSPFDSGSEETWRKHGITSEDVGRISDWAKITSSGVVLSSADFQSGQKSHDYITYAMIKAANMGISLHDQMVKNTCLHEGRGHGFIDAILDHYLGNSDRYSTEGFAGGLGQDNRIEQPVSQQELQDFLSDKLPRDEDRMYDIGYRIMPVFLTKLHSAVMKARGVNDEKAWEEIIAASLTGARNISLIPNQTPDEKHAKFMPEMLRLVGYEKDLEAVIFESKGEKSTPLPTRVTQLAPSFANTDAA